MITFDQHLGSAPDPTKSTDWSVSVGSVTSPTDPTLGFRIEIGRLVGWSVGGRSVVGLLVGRWSVLPTHSLKLSFLECSRGNFGVYYNF